MYILALAPFGLDFISFLTEKNKEETNESEQKMDDEDDESTDSWTIEEKERLLQFVTKVFLMNFPSYMAYKHVVHSTLEVSGF